MARAMAMREFRRIILSISSCSIVIAGLQDITLYSTSKYALKQANLFCFKLPKG
jgi:hypothetical protein